MTELSNQQLRLVDRTGGRLIADFRLSRCILFNCYLCLQCEPQYRSVVQNVHLCDCEAINCSIGPAVVRSVTIENLRLNQLLICWGTVFEHVVLRGRIGTIKVNAEVGGPEISSTVQAEFDRAREQFYSRIEWALDVSEAEFSSPPEFSSVPATLIRRNPDTQAVVLREALRPDWSLKVQETNPWRPWIDGLLRMNMKSVLLAVPTRHRDRGVYQAGLDELRALGITSE